jgi:hypothetical protein
VAFGLFTGSRFLKVVRDATTLNVPHRAMVASDIGLGTLEELAAARACVPDVAPLQTE